ncbi:MAG: glycosyltransferase [Sediminicola sp.]
MNENSIYDVSIVCANYNNGKYLNEFLESVLNSSSQPKELIIVDDGSTDDSLKILKGYNLDFLKIISLKENVGFANALNIGVEHASCKYILRVDPDDLLGKDRIRTQCDFLDRNKNIDITGSNAIYFRDNINTVVGSSNFPIEEIDIINRYKKGEHGLLHGTVTGKTSLFKENRYYQSNVPAEDYDIFSRMIAMGAKPKSISENLTYVRIHKNSISNSLPYNTIKLTYQLRDGIFHTNTSKIVILINYLSIKFYRKYYYEQAPLKKFCFLGISAFFRPDKAIRKLF